MTKDTSVSLGQGPDNSDLEEQELKIENIRNAIIKGEESGAPTDFDMKAFFAVKRKSS